MAATTSNENLFPGRIIPDGAGGVLVTWSVVPGTAPIPPAPPATPYRAARVSAAGVVGSSYDLPFTIPTAVYGKYPTLVLSQNGIAFATDETNTSVGPKVVAFNLDTGLVSWTYQAASNSTVNLLAATAGGGLAINDSQVGIVEFDDVGVSSTVATVAGGLAAYSWTGQWYVHGTTGLSGIMLPIEVDAAGEWATPKGNASQNGAGVPLCSCRIQNAPESAPLVADLRKGPGRTRSGQAATSSVLGT